MISNFINEYPYTNLTYANIDWLIKKVKELSGDTEDTDAGIQAFLGAYANEYPYSNLTYANIDWLIKNVGGLDAEVTKLSAQMETLQADVDNATTKLGDKVDKLNVKNNVYVTDGSTPPKTIGIQYLESPLEGTIPIRDGIGSLQVPTAQDATQAVNKGQMDTGLADKLDKITAPNYVYVTSAQGEQAGAKKAIDPVDWSIMQRGDGGRSQVNDPVDDKDIANKGFVVNAIKTAPGGWTTVIDKAFTEDVTVTTAGYPISIPTEYQKPITELRLRYYMNTPRAGAIFSSTMQAAVVDAAQNPCSIAYVATNKLIDHDKTDITVDFQSVTDKNATVLSGGISDLYSNCYGIFLYKDASGNAVQPIPTDPNALLNTSKIIGTAQTGQDTTEYVLNSCLPNRSHSYTPNSTQTAVNYTSNDYYNDGLSDCIISQILTSTDETNLPVGAFICVQRQDLKFALNISISFSSTTAISYKQVFTVHADIIDESIQSTYSGLTLKNTLTSFDSRVGVETLSGNSAVTYYNGTFNDGTPTAIKLFVPNSTSNGVAARKIYAGSRLIVQVKY